MVRSAISLSCWILKTCGDGYTTATLEYLLCTSLLGKTTNHTKIKFFKKSNLNFLSCSFFLLPFFYPTFLFHGGDLVSGIVVTPFSMLSDSSLSLGVFCARLDKPNPAPPQKLCAQTPHCLGNLLLSPIQFLNPELHLRSTRNWQTSLDGSSAADWCLFPVQKGLSGCWHSSHPLPT